MASGDSGSGGNNLGGMDLREAVSFGCKIVALIVAVTILSFGAIGLAAYFIYMAFTHPDAAATLLPVLIPGGIAAVSLGYGKKVIKVLQNGQSDKK